MARKVAELARRRRVAHHIILPHLKSESESQSPGTPRCACLSAAATERSASEFFNQSPGTGRARAGVVTGESLVKSSPHLQGPRLA